MGYSMYVRTETIKQRDEMFDFLQKYLRHEEFCEKLSLYSGARLAKGHRGDAGLSYCDYEKTVGFDFNCCDPEREYMYTIVKWMAVKLGLKHYYYDEEKVEITASNNKERRNWITKVLGMVFANKSLKLIDEELLWLENAWSKRI